MLKQKLENDLKHLISSLGFQESDIVLSIPKNPEFGEYTTNMALQLGNQSGGDGKQNAVDIANTILEQIKKDPHMLDYLEKAEVAGPGFINFYFKTSALMQNLHKVCDYSYFVDPSQHDGESKQKILLEYAQPNTHKAFHIGHTRNIALGDIDNCAIGVKI